MKVNPERMRDARLGANMSRADLAVALRRVTSDRLKASERGIRGWEKGEYKPSADVIPAYALATGRSLDFFYADGTADGDLDDEASSAALSRDLGVMFQRTLDAAVEAAVAKAVKA